MFVCHCLKRKYTPYLGDICSMDEVTGGNLGLKFNGEMNIYSFYAQSCLFGTGKLDRYRWTRDGETESLPTFGNLILCAQLDYMDQFRV